MRAAVGSAERGHDEAIAVLATLMRLEREVSRANQQLERLEAALHEALAELARTRFEGYR